jgi:hypothetical protein
VLKELVKDVMNHIETEKIIFVKNVEYKTRKMKRKEWKRKN